MAGRPRGQVLQLVALQSVLILRGALLASDAQILRRLQKQSHSWKRVELRPQARNDLVGRRLSDAPRLQA